MEGYNEFNRFVWGSDALSALVLRATESPDALSELEYTRLNAVTRSYTNHVCKLFRLYEQGVFPEKEWRNSAAEAAQFFSTIPHFVSFKLKNHFR